MADNIRKVHASGHQLASHTWEHRNLALLGVDELHYQMLKTEGCTVLSPVTVTDCRSIEALEKIVGVSPAFMRPPYGLHNELVREVAGSRNQSGPCFTQTCQSSLTRFQWLSGTLSSSFLSVSYYVLIASSSSGDSAGASPAQFQANYRNIADQRPNNILTLNHETVEYVAQEAFATVLRELTDKGYDLVTVAECLGEEPYKAIGTTNVAGRRDSTWRC
jgi:peptidoglycan/xylan/chitin deacetylase (PgdA/CDA1 family)